MKILGELLPLAIIACLVLTFAFYAGGWALLLTGAREGWKILVRFAPLFMLAFLVVGEVKVLMEKHIDPEQIASWLSGAKGVWFAFLGGIFTPVILPLYPIFKSLWDAQSAEPRSLCFWLHSPLTGR